MKLSLGKKTILAIVLLRPAQLTPGESLIVSVDGCTGKLAVK